MRFSVDSKQVLEITSMTTSEAAFIFDGTALDKSEEVIRLESDNRDLRKTIADERSWKLKAQGEISAYSEIIDKLIEKL